MAGRRCAGRLAGALALVAVVLLAPAAPVAAHPLGNFTVNRYARVEVSAGVVRVHYVLDEAEIPAFQSRREVAAGRARFAERRARDIARGLRLSVDAAPLDLRPLRHRLTEPAGQGGLTTLRLAVTLEALLPAGGRSDTVHQVSFADDNEPGRIGWREVVVIARGDARLVESDAPRVDVTDELRSYPADLLQAPLDRRRASFSFTPGERHVGPSALTAPAAPTRRGGGFAALVERPVHGPALLGLLALALGFGAVHALGPGHGKTVMAAYLVGTRGRPRDAVALGGAVSLMHTASVLVLGLVLLRLDRTVAPDRVYPWLTVVSGVAVAVAGTWLLVNRWRCRGSAEGHSHSHGHSHRHSHSNGHSHGQDDRHTPQASPGPLTRAGLVALAASGGLFPSPTAVLVVVSAFSVERAGLGLALVTAFSIGLALTLTAVGMALVHGRGVMERRGAHRLLGVLPIVGAAVLVLTGVVLAGRGLSEVG